MWSVESNIQIDAPPRDVWRLYMDPATWPRWAHSTAQATADRPLELGTHITVQPLRGPRQKVRVITFRPEQLLVTELPLPGARMTFHYEIDAAPNGCWVRHAVSMDGPLSGLLGLFMRRNNARKLAGEVAHLAREVKAGPAP